jgi:Cu/Ag efflux protein CusF
MEVTRMNYPKLTARAAATVLMACAVGALPLAATAQSSMSAPQAATATNAIPQSEEVILQAKIKKINTETRVITLEGPNGDRVTVTAGPLVRLNLLKVGDTVNAKYYRSVAFLINGPTGGNGTPVSNDQMAAAVARPATAPGGVAIGVIKISGTVVGVDLASNTINVVNPSGGQVYTLDVTDPARQAMLPTLNVGDTITAVISQTLAVEVTPAPKHWW